MVWIVEPALTCQVVLMVIAQILIHCNQSLSSVIAKMAGRELFVISVSKFKLAIKTLPNQVVDEEEVLCFQPLVMSTATTKGSV